jgi:hypothetical protein
MQFPLPHELAVIEHGHTGAAHTQIQERTGVQGQSKLQYYLGHIKYIDCLQLIMINKSVICALVLQLTSSNSSVRKIQQAFRLAATHRRYSICACVSNSWLSSALDTCAQNTQTESAKTCGNTQETLWRARQTAVWTRVGDSWRGQMHFPTKV